MNESVDVKVARMEEKIDSINHSIEELKSALTKHTDWEEFKYSKLEEKIDERDKTYATKDMLKWTGGVIMAVVTIVFAVIEFIA